MAEIDYRTRRVMLDESQLAAWEVATDLDGTSVHARGECPACHASLEQLVPMDLVVTAGAGTGAERTFTRTFHCSCSEDHPGRPDKQQMGCGRFWTVKIRQADGKFTAEEPDVELIAAADEVERIARNQIDTTRASGEKWIGAVTAILGLLGIAGVAVGKDAVAGLDDTPKILTGIAIGLAVFAAILAIIFAYHAAYGWPRIIDISDDDKLRAWYAEWIGRAATAADRLKIAVALSVSALVLLTVGASLIWYGASASPDPATVSVTYNEEGDDSRPATVCGVLLKSEGAELLVAVVDGPTTRTQVVHGAWIAKISPTTKC